MEFILLVVIVVVGTVIKKLSERSTTGSAARNARVQQLLQKRLATPPAGQQHPAAPTSLPAYQQLGLNQRRPQQKSLPAPQADVDTRVRELMASHKEVAAIRLLCDERDMGIIEAQEYARGLTAPLATHTTSTAGSPQAAAEPIEEESRYVGSAAFAESVFDLGSEGSVWASGWVDEPVREDRSDMDELWQTVRNAGAPRPS
ncbi:MAG TPA: hypothetical protein VFT31_13610 [Kribbella sp.]|nr:hypothetical protein [Kribbella sp.]